MILGAHVSTSGGIHNAIKNGTDLECDTIQIFLRNPNQWQGKPPTSEIAEKFTTAWSEVGLGEVIVHDIHLSNLASPKPDVLEKSRQAFREQMELAQRLGLRYIVTHLGAHLGEGETFGLKQLTDSLISCLKMRKHRMSCPSSKRLPGKGQILATVLNTYEM